MAHTRGRLDSRKLGIFRILLKMATLAALASSWVAEYTPIGSVSEQKRHLKYDGSALLSCRVPSEAQGMREMMSMRRHWSSSSKCENWSLRSSQYRP